MPRDLVYIILDSCRFDSYRRARTPNMDKIGKGEMRYSYASWTAPSHHSIFMGQVAHKAPKRVLASEVYKKDFALGSNEPALPTFRSRVSCRI